MKLRARGVCEVYDGKTINVFYPGDVFEVPEDQAARFLLGGHADAVRVEAQSQKTEDDPEMKSKVAKKQKLPVE